MFSLSKNNLNLKKLEVFAKNIANSSSLGDVYLLSGNLGTGKTTFARYFINSLFDKHLIKKPGSIKSPSFPILINYSLKNYEVLHYDLYRLNNINDLQELYIDENIEKNIILIEWPELILKKKLLKNYFIINFEIISTNIRMIELFHTHKKTLNNEI